MKCLLTTIISWCALTMCSATIISANRLVDWVPGVTVGNQTPIPNRTTLIDVTLSPYNADKTGVSDCTTNIQGAINAAVSNNVVYLPAGRYRISGSLLLDKSYITLRGDGTNSVLLGITQSSYVLKVGHDIMGADANRTYVVTNGFAKGSTNLGLLAITNHYGDTLKAGDMLTLSTTTRNTGSDAMPIINNANYDRTIKQNVVVASRAGNTVNITAPLIWDFTNSPILTEIDTISQPRRSVSIENLSITLTNTGESGISTFMIFASCLRDCVFTNLDLGYANNYQLYLPNTVNCLVSGCYIHDPLSTGTSHSGMLLAGDIGLLIENNIFTSIPTRGITLFPAIEVNDGVMNCAFVGNYFTNNATDIDMHNTHPMMNLFEQNIFWSFFELDGYFGSSSHWTILRNKIEKTMPIKRFTSNLNIIGNSIGDTNLAYIYSTEVSSYSGPPWPLFEFGYPHIGNAGFTGVAPPVSWNFPGRTMTGFFGEVITNGVIIANAPAFATNTLWGNYTNVLAPVAAGYAIIFQAAANTNYYYGDTNGTVLLSTAAGTSSNLSLNAYVFVTNGDTMYIAGQNAYDQLQSSNKYTHILHGNILYTNGVGQAGTLVWDGTISDHNIPTSMIYTNGAPSWWGTNRWPAIDTTNSPLVMTIPAEDRFNGITGGGGSGGGGGSMPSTSITTLNVRTIIQQ